MPVTQTSELVLVSRLPSICWLSFWHLGIQAITSDPCDTKCDIICYIFIWFVKYLEAKEAIQAVFVFSLQVQVKEKIRL